MKILITGATGLVGSMLSELCIDKGHDVHYLTTSKDKIVSEKHFKGFYWNPEDDVIDEACIVDVDVIIHLAGAPIAKRWTSSYKKEIISSRIETAKLLKKLLINSKTHKVHHFISASGIGIYESSYTQLHTEESQQLGDDFLAKVVRQWEAAADDFQELGIDVAKLRFGMVLSDKDGALKKIVEPIKYYVGAVLGTGEQWQSWIHVKDLARMFLHVIDNNLEGVYNAVSSNPVTNKVLTKRAAYLLDKPILLPNVPKFMLKLTFGEMATVVLSSQIVSNDKITSTGFVFEHHNLKVALEDLLQN